VRPLGRSGWLVSGLLRDDEVEDATGFEMPPGEYETLAGFVLWQLGRIPDVGDEVRVDGWRITVLRMDKHRIADLRLAHATEPVIAPPNGIAPPKEPASRNGHSPADRQADGDGDADGDADGHADRRARLADEPAARRTGGRS
jgi:hypothetical protein